ncbi:DUF2249 domain-containing protein [Nocardioides guangzhouensis]|uniref:DUF2249 domain-containing protein n=1 Tax=Nocardioides guangzhouensis TaxID=2497878 RepID=A0A4Q4Z9A4_9ACTN|nr:DUF2249 domain-containing protein [Nocardioides guangzhouensis]RYP84490.1 DUF2249 domain-containing protein [Nocardioides guangzhouensis]
MSELVIASNEADAHAAEAVKQHHAALAGALNLHTEALFTTASGRDPAAAEQARRDLVGWCERELIPHALAEEQALYPAAQATIEGRLLIEAMLGEHDVITGLLREVADSADLLRAAGSAAALRAVFDSHLTKENDLVVPLLAATPGVSLHDLLGGMHQLLGHRDLTEAEERAEAGTGCGGHACSCGEVDGPGYPELDVRAVPHAIRHATIFGALESVQPGAGLELVAPHDPLPLLDQINQRWPGAFAVAYRERGPEAWRLTLERTDA